MDEKSKKGDAQGSRLLVDGLKYRLGLVIPYANTWDQVQTIIEFIFNYI